ncbi:hypothetical protein LguiB_025922 [Lonicera macranthoides]
MRPAGELFKVNYDASKVEGSNRVGIGVVIRDFNGDFYTGMSKTGGLMMSSERC